MLFLTLGFAFVLGLGDLRASLTSAELLWLSGAALSALLGSLAFMCSWPDYAWHRHKFRGHEVFHVGTLGVFAGLYMCMFSLVRRM